MKFTLTWQETRTGVVEADSYEQARDAWLARDEDIGVAHDTPPPQLLSIEEEAHDE